ncbi:hypothetical protein RHMOL_Rhmol06G0239500 [Rhododendron molle]|uniref:Uncharacterized protein n=1 Tax=Rhododendron molle TaxID=49168 RepID=A0ACC0NGX1_RHOML|nr:hypothetical protein RHMOL_Rhmol06G0239500 [Rhododendron molle]
MDLMMSSIMVVAVDGEVVVDTGMEVVDVVDMVDMEVAGAVNMDRPMGLMMPSIMVVAVDGEVVVDTGMEVADAVDTVDMEAVVMKKGINIIGANI